MRIRLLASWLDRRSGSATWMRAFAEGLAARGHRVEILCLGPEDAPSPGGVEAEDFHVLTPPHFTLPGWWRFDHLRAFLSARRRIAALGLDAPDLVVASEHSLIAAHHRLFPGVPWVYLPHSAPAGAGETMAAFSADPLARALLRRLYGRAQRRAIATADAVVRFTEPAMRKMLADFPGVEARRAVVIPPAVELPEDAEPPAGQAPVRLLALGRLVRDKRVDLLIEILSHLSKDARWTLDVVGEGPERGRLEEMAASLGLEKKITFHGHKDEVAGFYRACDLFLFPSRDESLGLAPLEAMSHARPVLAFDPDAPGVQLLGGRLVEHGLTGWMARDDEDFLRILHLLITNPSPLRPTGRAARRLVAERHSWPVHLDRWEGLFDELRGDPASD
ncbi:MAG: glycosyltransferase family 1 protein [Alphaproteobacteria bacterium]|nr:MAG: glycosyltransferase family 1 protein [Alphaproteobacteria bacterium]